MVLFRPTFKIGAFVMLFWAVAMLLPALVSMHDWSEAINNLYSSAICLLLSALLYSLGRGQINHIQPRALFMVTAVNWLLLCLTGTLPYLFSEIDISFTDSLFESTSGITTTGATIFYNIENLPRGILLWRSISQWVGGIGIILVAVAILPSLKIGGMKLFRSEFSEWSQLETGRISKIAIHIISFYLLTSVLCFAAFITFDMEWFEALNHTMTTVSTAGFSTQDASFGHYHDTHLELVASIFMILGACPFLSVMISITNRRMMIFRDPQVQHLVLMALLSTLLIAAWRYIKADTPQLLAIIESSFFNVVSIATTTGFTSENYELWGSFPVMIMCFLMFSGGASGSTSGGIKLFRYHLLFIFMKEHIHLALHPGTKISRQYNNRPIQDDVLVASLSFFFFVIVSLCVSASLLAANGLDPVTSFTGALSALMNVGPAFGDLIGPSGHYGHLPSFSKYVLGADMLLGRLEYLTLVIIFTRGYWKW